MRKRILSIVLTLCMVLTLTPAMPVRVSAATHADHCICGVSHTNVGDHTDSEKYSGTWTGTATLPTQSGYYYLTQDVTLSSQWKPADGTVLCLNGHTITSTYATGVLCVGSSNNNSNVNFTLTDCRTSGSGKICSQVYTPPICNYSTFNMYGGSIQNPNGLGASNYGTFNMYGGSISQNSNIGLSNYENGTFNMYGGSISQNSNIGLSNYQNGKFTMSGGEITGNGSGVSNDGDIIVSGSAKIYENSNANVRLNNPSEKKIQIKGSLTAESKIGVSVYSSQMSTAPPLLLLQ